MSTKTILWIMFLNHFKISNTFCFLILNIDGYFSLEISELYFLLFLQTEHFLVVLEEYYKLVEYLGGNINIIFIA